jgi:hypothetical protein
MQHFGGREGAPPTVLSELQMQTTDTLKVQKPSVGILGVAHQRQRRYTNCHVIRACKGPQLRF